MDISFVFRMKLFNIIFELYFFLIIFKRLIYCNVLMIYKVVLFENLFYVECVVELFKKGEFLIFGNRYCYRLCLKGDFSIVIVVIKNLF